MNSTLKLQRFGLSEKEAQVYESLYTLGTSIVSSVAKKAGVNRSTAYVLLESLATKGLVSISTRGSIRVYSPAPADRFTKMAEQSVKDFTELISVGKELAAEMRSEHGASVAKPDIQVFQGTESLKIINEEIRASKDKGVKKFMLTSIKDDQQQASEITVYENKLALISPTDKIAYVIENKEFADGVKTLIASAPKQSVRFPIASEEKNPKNHAKHPAVTKAEKRFWKA